MGLNGKFGTYWKFKVVSQLSNDRNAFPNDYRQWGHETFRAANLIFNADQFWNFEQVDSLKLATAGEPEGWRMNGSVPLR